MGLVGAARRVAGVSGKDGNPLPTIPTIRPGGQRPRRPYDGIRGFSATFTGWREAIVVGLALTAWSLLFRGFDGGRWSDVPIFKSFVDPRLYVNDPFIATLHEGTPAAYTYRFIAAVVGLFPGLPIEWPLFLLYLPASVASLALLYRVALHLVDDRVSAVLFLVLYVAGFRLLAVGSTILHSAELTPAFLALPLQLGALYALLVGRHAAAGVLAGLALNVHAPTSSYVAAAIGLVYLLRVAGRGARGASGGADTPSRLIRDLILVGGLMVLFGLPTLVGSLGRHADALPGWALQLARIELATDLSTAINWERPALLVRNLAGLTLLLVAMLAVRGDRDRPTVLRLFGAVVLLCAVAYLFVDLSLRGPISTLVARLQTPRSAWLVNLFGLAYVAHYLRTAWATERLPRPLVLVLAAAMLASPSDFTPAEPIWLATVALVVAAELLYRRLPVGRRPAAFRALSALAVLSVVGLASARLLARRAWVVDFDDALVVAAMAGVLLAGWLLWEFLRQRVELKTALAAGLILSLGGAVMVTGSPDWLYAQRHQGGLAAAAAFQDWVRTETPTGSVFLILPSEPNNETFYERAERALYLIRERANQAVYFREHNFAFRDRVLALGVSDVLRYREELDPMYRRLTEERVRELAARFGVTHFVPARAGDYSFPIVYQQGGWTVYYVGSGG